MRSLVQSWGNSLAVRIPKPVAVELGIRRGTAVELDVSEGRIVVRPVRRRAPKLQELLAKVTDENLHSEVDFGDAKGGEAW